MNSTPRIIAFYLPQFHPTPENDEWWGKGFTEWTNVGKAKPLFKGHYQPRVPADLGYYDLRIPEIREQQAELAKEAGIEGFCYWHYWFAGKRLLDKVFKKVVETGKPDYPFCLCWANHSWYAKTWDPKISDKLLIEQTYPGEQDYIDHFYAMLPAFKDKRYIKINGKLLYGVYAPLHIPDAKLFMDTWNNLAQRNGLKGFYFFGFTFFPNQIENIIKIGYDSAVYDNTIYVAKRQKNFIQLTQKIKRKLFKIPYLVKYDEYIKSTLKMYPRQNNVHPCIIPNFDHSPRSAHRGIIIIDNTPTKWEQFCLDLFNLVKTREHEENLVFIKAWNEWGEGNYLEPDLKFGKEYIIRTKKAYEIFDQENNSENT